MKILYFTASGNSLHIVKSLGGELLPVPQLIKEETCSFTADKIAIVFSIHSWAAPLIVVEFFKKARFNCGYLFAVATYGAYYSAVSNRLREITTEAGFHFSYVNRIRMVDNYLPTFDMEKEIAKGPKRLKVHAMGEGIDKYLSVDDTCVHNCPRKAIHVKSELNGSRYRNIKLKEIVQANN